MILDPQTIASIGEHVRWEFPREACGLISGGLYVPCRNRSEHPTREFVISPVDYIRAGIVQAVVHSHVLSELRYGEDPRLPSVADQRAQTASAVPWGITACDGKDVMGLLWFGGEPEPYVGRRFLFGINDCRTLVIDWYLKEHCIRIAKVPCETNFWLGDGAAKMILAQAGTLIDAGFSVTEGRPRPGDVCGMRICSNQPNHTGVYLGGDQILHHLPGRPSGIDSYARWSKYECVRYRHPSLEA